jgi:hypothetical protein
MNFSFFPFRTLLPIFAIFCLFTSHAQPDIKFRGLNINTLDKQQRKQGNWIFFDPTGMPVMSCVFKDDNCKSPIIFYENGDTAFVRFLRTDSVEPYILYESGRQYFGNFIHTSDSTSRIEIEPDSSLDDHVINRVMKFQNISLEPVYYFAQKRMVDFLSAGFISSNIIFNKPINVLLTISGSGLVTKVDFPRDKNNLLPHEESEIRWIYSKMPRWQPYFHGGRVRVARVMISNNSSLEIMGFER